MPLYAKPLDEAEREQLIERVAPHAGRLLLVFKVVLASLLMMRFYKLGEKLKQARALKQKQAAMQRQASAGGSGDAAAASAAEAEGHKPRKAATGSSGKKAMLKAA